MSVDMRMRLRVKSINVDQEAKDFELDLDADFKEIFDHLRIGEEIVLVSGEVVSVKRIIRDLRSDRIIVVLKDHTCYHSNDYDGLIKNLSLTGWKTIKDVNCV